MEYVDYAFAIIAIIALVVALLGILIALVEDLIDAPSRGWICDGFLGLQIVKVGAVVVFVFFCFTAIVDIVFLGMH